MSLTELLDKSDEQEILIRPITGYNGYYIDIYGSVWSCNRKPLLVQLKASRDTKGYLHVSLSSDTGKRFTKKVHGLVLSEFIGPRPCGHHGAHINGSKTDNRLANLAWVTPKTNEEHKRLHGRTAKGDRHGCHKLTEKQVKRILKVYWSSGWYSNRKQLAKKYKVSVSTIQNIVGGRQWKHLKVT